MKIKQKAKSTTTKSTTTAKPKSAPWKHYTQSQSQQEEENNDNHKGDVPLIRSATKQNYNTEKDEEVLPVSSLDEATAAEDFERELSSQLTGCW